MIDLNLSGEELEEARGHILTFISETVEGAGASGAVIGLSGGVDSALTAALAVEALGKTRVRGLILPSEVSSSENVDDAKELAEILGIEHEVLNIGPIMNSLLEAYPEAEGDRMAVGNASARIRAVLNYLVANHKDLIVLGTGNRSEILVGYYTKYGDGAVDCLPIGNLYKQQVRQMAEEVGVPDSIVNKTATAELWEEQTDEEEMGMSYDTLDAVLAMYVDGGFSSSATARALDLPGDTVEKVREMHRASEHKRNVPPAPEPLLH